MTLRQCLKHVGPLRLCPTSASASTTTQSNTSQFIQIRRASSSQRKDTPAQPLPASEQPIGSSTTDLSPRVKRVLERRNFRFAFPEFLPDPDPHFRNPLCELLQRKDMLRRRDKVDVPEFYVGSVVSVTMSDTQATAENKTTTFTGIVIDRGGTGLRAWFVVRNIVDHQGVEIMYQIYSPNIVSIETLKLERRLDEELYYLRDAAPEHSTVDPNMDPVLLAEGEPVPLNDTVVELNPKPWTARWELKDDLLDGYTYTLLPVDHQRDGMPLVKQIWRKEKHSQYLNAGWQRETQKYDLMLHYHRTVPVEQQDAIWEEVGDKLEARDREIKRAAIKKSLVKTEKKPGS